MKKILVSFILVSVVLGLYSEENLLWCKKILFNEPTTHVIQKGDYFSKLSQRYYGTTTYWRELALINRAPNKDLVFPGEKVVIPSLEAVKKLRKARSLSVVNEIVEDQNEWIAEHGNITTQYAFEAENKKARQEQVAEAEETVKNEIAAEVPVAQTATLKPLADTQPAREYEESSVLPLILTIVAVALIVGAMSLYLYRRKKKYELEAFEPSEPNEETAMADDDEDRDEVFSEPFPEPEREREEMLVN